ncbi:hypothetical protein QBC43DRAFT_143330 [Cladorrhinum sp. PSN259]|nr:hypothetical protein QBC43DRAFT_143330 [Cladorrhinum sp. PSN259]
MSKPEPSSSSESPPPWVQTPSSNTSPQRTSSKSQQAPATNPDKLLISAAQTIQPSDFLTFHQAPCARTGLLTGIGAGSAVGVIRWLVGLPVPRAANWAVGAGVVASIGQYEYCQFRRRQEKEKLKRVVEVYGKVQAEQRAKEAREAQQQKAAEEEVRKQKEQQNKVKSGGGSGWVGRLKFW